MRTGTKTESAIAFITVSLLVAVSAEDYLFQCPRYQLKLDLDTPLEA